MSNSRVQAEPLRRTAKAVRLLFSADTPITGFPEEPATAEFFGFMDETE
jgi:hypothetical protein